MSAVEWASDVDQYQGVCVGYLVSVVFTSASQQY